MTISFDPGSERWKSRYSYDTSCFESLNNTMLTFNTSTQGEDVCYYHDYNAAKNTFYGVQTDSQMSLSFNANPSSNKVYNALSLEGANLLNARSVLRTNYSPDPQQDNETQDWEGFTEKGGIFYAGVTKVASSSNENALKFVGEITGASSVRINPAEEPNINDGVFPFAGITLNDEWWNYIFFFLIPGPHYRALDSASSEDIISKYYVGVEVGGEVSVRPFRAQENPGPVFNFLSPQLPIGQITDHDNQPFDTLLTNVYNTNLQAKIGNNTLMARVTNEVLINAPNEFTNGIGLAAAINDYLLNNNQRLFLYKITDDRIDGSDPMGQYADITLNLGSQDFELFAVNAQYNTTALDHSN